MFCPNCGMQTAIEQKFCRQCGLALEKVSQELIRQNAAELQIRSRFQLIMGKAAVVAFSGLGLGGVGLVSLLIYLLVTDIILRKGWVLFGVVFIVILICAFVSLFYVIYTKITEDTAKSPVKSQTRISGVGRAKLLEEKPFDRIPTSVTEITTQNLYAAPRRKTTNELG